MSETRKWLYLLISGGFHMLAAVLVVFLVRTSEPIFENVEITSYVTPDQKSNQGLKIKNKSHKINELTDKIIGTQNTENTSSGQTSHENGENTEDLAAEGAITAPAVLVSQVKANRTEAARQADYSGVAQIELVVGSDGNVKNAKLRNNLPYGLDEVALKVALDSKFRPAMVNNKPVASAILFKVRFESEK